MRIYQGKGIINHNTEPGINHVNVIWPIGKQGYTAYITQNYGIINLEKGRVALDLWLDNLEQTGQIVDIATVIDNLSVSRSEQMNSAQKINEVFSTLFPDSYIVENERIAKKLLDWHEAQIYAAISPIVKRISDKNLDRIFKS